MLVVSYAIPVPEIKCYCVIAVKLKKHLAEQYIICRSLGEVKIVMPDEAQASTLNRMN
jgi:hypothetical protein